MLNVSTSSSYACVVKLYGTCVVYVSGTISGAVSDCVFDLSDTTISTLVVAVQPTSVPVLGGIKLKVNIQGAINTTYAPLDTLLVSKLGGLQDQQGNKIVAGYSSGSSAFSPPKIPFHAIVGVRKVGTAIPQYSMVKLIGSSSACLLAQADTAPNASGVLAFVFTELAANGYGLAALQGNMLPVSFDTVPAQGAIAYLSETNAGAVKVSGAPSNPRILGNAVEQMDGTMVLNFNPVPG